MAVGWKKNATTITLTDLAAQVVALQQASGVVFNDRAPDNNTVIWGDTSGDTTIIYYYDTTTEEWISISTGGAGSGYYNAP